MVRFRVALLRRTTASYVDTAPAYISTYTSHFKLMRDIYLGGWMTEWARIADAGLTLQLDFIQRYGQLGNQHVLGERVRVEQRELDR